jgi:DNA mismatch repair protein MutL
MSAAVSQPQIHVLSDHVANKIAAGEVVDRPASVLKELMENALDAGATRIDVALVAGGKRLITVRDNGHGMDRDNALLAIERHATSKIRDVDDIEAVSTLGFRGEALAAIASVSRFTLQTRPADELEGTEIQINGGKIASVEQVGCPPGTTFQVRNLFFNVPARRKFLRTEQTELTHLRQTFLVYALSHPEAGMTLTIDDRPVYELGEGGTLEDRLAELFGESLRRGVVPVAYAQNGVHVDGFVGRPHMHRADRSEQFIFVNGRPASAPLIGFALNEAYHTLVPKGRYPSLFLFLTMPPDLVDVNVHPTKKEVRFRRTDLVRDAVIAALRQVLTQPGSGQAVAPDEQGRAGIPPVPPEPRVRIEDLPSLPMFSYPRLSPADEGRPPGSPSLPPAEKDGSEDVPSGSAGSGSSPWSWCRVLGQVGGLYVVMETEDGLVLMDPHAAHERLLFERFMAQAVARKVKSQGLLTPEAVELTPADAALVNKQLPLLEAMGFGISCFGGDTFMVDALPVCLGNASAQAILVAVAESLDQRGERGGTPQWAEERVAKAACRAAVKARDKLTLQEIERLVIDLAGAEMPYTCPHGRPTLIFMGFRELDRKFGRIT